MQWNWMQWLWTEVRGASALAICKIMNSPSSDISPVSIEIMVVWADLFVFTGRLYKSRLIVWLNICRVGPWACAVQCKFKALWMFLEEFSTTEYKESGESKRELTLLNRKIIASIICSRTAGIYGYVYTHMHIKYMEISVDLCGCTDRGG